MSDHFDTAIHGNTDNKMVSVSVSKFRVTKILIKPKSVSRKPGIRGNCITIIYLKSI